jgi:ADP-heptose:LPS heptosyltransferase
MHEFKAKRIAISFIHGLGDAIFTLPMLVWLKQHRPQMRIYALVSKNSRLVVEPYPELYDEIIFLDSFAKRDLFSMISSIKRLRNLRLDYLIWPSSGCTNWLSLFMYVSGAKLLAGVRTLQQHSFVHYLLDLVREPENKFHYTRQNIKLLDQIFGANTEADWQSYARKIDYGRMIKKIPPTDSLRANILSKVTIGIVPMSYKGDINMRSRQWPIEKYIELANRLRLRKNYQIYWFGTPYEINKLRYLANAITDSDVLVNYNFNINLSFFSMMKIIIGNDSFLPSLAPYIGLNSVRIIGPTSWRQTLYGSGESNNIDMHPTNLKCYPCWEHKRLGKCDYSHACLKGHDVDQVEEAVLKALR